MLPRVKSMLNRCIVFGITTTASVSFAFAQGAISPTCTRFASPTGITPFSGTIAPNPSFIIDREARRAASELVYRIENGADPYIGLTGNFDGEGMSVGLIQFNFGGSIQSTFRGIDRSVFQRTMPVYGDIMFRAVNSRPAEAKALALQMQRRSSNSQKGASWTFIPEASQELRTFLGSTEGKLAQDNAVRQQFDKSVSLAAAWALAARGATHPTNREVAFFFDQQVFNGGSLNGMWLLQAKQFRTSFSNDGAMIAFVANWLESCASNPASGFLHGSREARANANTWRSAVPIGQSLSDEKALLFAQGFLRALVSNGPSEPEQRGIFKAQVVSRRGMIALGVGSGNGVSWPGGILNN
jgi:hypothetical protein